MRQTRVAIPEVALIAVTRGMLGVGFGLLISEKLSRARRRTVGIALAAIGALSTIPIAIRLFRRRAVDQRAQTMAD